jgi:phosphatidylserine/phosphatidylglycerophosphate/cardiolipin synthase-like enzyme
MKALAFSNNDLAIAAWTFDRKLEGCIGFAIWRHDMQSGTETPLLAKAVFEGQTGTNLTTEQAPVQKFWWKDLGAKRGGAYRYRIVPMGGKVGALKPLDGVEPLVTNVTTVTHVRGVFSAYFNRGILATQAVTAALAGKPSADKLNRRIAKADDDLRRRLMGEIYDGVTALLKRADTSGGKDDILAALYELNDPDGLEKVLGGNGNKAVAKTRTVVLGNEFIAADTKKGTLANPDADSINRQNLKNAGAGVIDRILPQGHIPHNKFLVLRADGKPQAVLMGSTNWTMNGLAAQTNNALVIESPAVAKLYEAYWKRLEADTDAAHGDAKKLQSDELRTQNRENNTSGDWRALKGKSGGNVVQLEDNSCSVQAFFSPNTEAHNLPSGKGKTPATPSDMDQVFQAIAGAKQAVLFLAFDPGNNSILEAAGRVLHDKPHLFVRGALTSDPRAPNFKIALAGEPGGPAKKGQKVEPDYRAIPATAVTENDAFGAWEAELLKAGFAVIHDKIVVVDPFSDDCVVVTGSHNLGFRASYNNDENMVIVRGHRPLAEAYACHVLDIYDHYAWRWWLKKKPEMFGKALQANDAWQDRYIKDSQTKSAELAFWLGAVPSGALPPDKMKPVVPVKGGRKTRGAKPAENKTVKKKAKKKAPAKNAKKKKA